MELVVLQVGAQIVGALAALVTCIGGLVLGWTAWEALG